jgi:tetratricopeptide (TPR) repeat protein
MRKSSDSDKPAAAVMAPESVHTGWLRPVGVAASVLLLVLWARDAVPRDEVPVTPVTHHHSVPPADANHWALLARTHAATGQWSDASKAFEQATALAPHDADLWAERARAAMAQGGASAAPGFAVRGWTQRALELDAQHPLALTLAGDMAYAASDLSGALQHWRAAMQHVDRAALSDPGLADVLRERLAALDSTLALVKVGRR